MGGIVRAVDHSHGDALPVAAAAGLVLRIYGYGDAVLIV